MTPEEQNLRIMKNKNNYNKWLYETISSHLHGDVLEIGCGVGTMIKTMTQNKKIKTITGVDINKKNIEELKKELKNKKIKIIEQDILKSLKGLKKYDSILCVNVLEHIENDVLALKQMKKLLKKNGEVIFILPSVKWAYGTIDKSDNHYRRYNKKDIKNKLGEAGFIIRKNKYINFLGLMGWIYHGKIRKLKIHEENDLGLFEKLVPIIKKIEKTIPPPLGLSLVVIGEKK